MGLDQLQHTFQGLAGLIEQTGVLGPDADTAKRHHHISWRAGGLGVNHELTRLTQSAGDIAANQTVRVLEPNGHRQPVTIADLFA